MNVYELNDDDWDAFVASLAVPAVYKPKLAELLNEPDPFVD